MVQAIKDIANELNADMRKDRAAKDSPSAYEAVHTQCPPNEWNPKKEGNDLQMKLTGQPAFERGATATPDLEVSMNQTQGSRNLLAGVQQVGREDEIYLQPQKAIQRSKETLTQKEKHTAVEYLVEALAQPTWWTCFQTCLVMLHRYQSQGSGIFHHPSELEAMMYPNSKKKKHKIKPEANLYLLDPNAIYRGRKPSELLSPQQAHVLAKRFGFKSTVISPSPQAFLDILQQYGPFIWVGNYKHSVVITGLEKKKDYFYVHYNDPSGGQKSYQEFYEFLINLMPSMGQIASKKSFVFHI